MAKQSIIIHCTKCSQYFSSVTGYNRHVRAIDPCLTDLTKYEFRQTWQGVWTQQTGNQALDLSNPLVLDGKKYTPPATHLSQQDRVIMALLPDTVSALAARSGITRAATLYTLEKKLANRVYNIGKIWYKIPENLDGADLPARFFKFLHNQLPLQIASVADPTEPINHLEFAVQLKKAVDKYYEHVLWYSYQAEQREQ